MKMLWMIVVSIVLSQEAYAEYDISACIDDKKSFYQCIDEFVEETLPDTDWCTIAPVDRHDKNQGFFVITIKLYSLGKTFHQQAHFLKPGTNGKLVSKAYGTWVLKDRSINITYSASSSNYSKVKFPTQVQIDFKDLTGQRLVVYNKNDDQAPKFGPITFRKCNHLVPAN